MSAKDTTISAKEKLSIISNLGTMIASGIPILEAVDSLVEETSGNSKKILLRLKDDLNQGKEIASTMEYFPGVFQQVEISLVRAAEEAGTLDTTLKDLSLSVKKDIEFTDKVKTALTYPVVVVGVFIAVMLLILIFVIPRIALVFSRLRVQLPLPTKILIFVSNIIVTFWPILIVALVVLGVGSFYLYKKEKRVLLNILFSLPFLGKLARQIDLTRFFRSMALLLSSGIPITQALELSKKVVTKTEVAKIIAKAQANVVAGRELSESFKNSKGVIPGLVLRVTQAGEKSGTLEKSMQEIAEYLDDEVTNTLKRLTTLLEPFMLLIIGVVVGAMMLAIIAPIYGLIGQIQGR